MYQAINKLSATLSTKFDILETPENLFFFTGKNVTENLMRLSKEDQKIYFQSKHFGQFREFCCYKDVMVCFTPACEIWRIVDDQLVQLKYNPQPDIKFLDTPPTPRRQFSVSANKRFIVVCGGEGCSCDSSLYIFDTVSSIWFQQKQNVPQWSYNSKIVSYQDDFLLCGGETYDERVNWITKIHPLNFDKLLTEYRTSDTAVFVEVVECKQLFRAKVSTNLLVRSAGILYVEDNHIFLIDPDLTNSVDVADVQKCVKLVGSADTIWLITEAGEIWDYIERGY